MSARALFWLPHFYARFECLSWTGTNSQILDQENLMILYHNKHFSVVLMRNQVGVFYCNLTVDSVETPPSMFLRMCHWRLSIFLWKTLAYFRRVFNRVVFFCKLKSRIMVDDDIFNVAHQYFSIYFFLSGFILSWDTGQW